MWSRPALSLCQTWSARPRRRCLHGRVSFAGSVLPGVSFLLGDARPHPPGNVH